MPAESAGTIDIGIKKVAEETGVLDTIDYSPTEVFKDVMFEGPQTVAENYNESKEAKIKYIQDVGGVEIENKSLGPQDYLLAIGLGRSQTHEMRRKKFLESYPEGDYQILTIPGKDEDYESFEIFKYDKSDKKYRMFDPVGLEIDVGDYEEVGKIADFQTFSEILAVTDEFMRGKGLWKAGAEVAAPAVKGFLKRLASGMGKTYGASLAGQNIDEFVDWMLGFGENQFRQLSENLKEETTFEDKAVELSKTFWNNTFSDEVQKEAFLSSLGYGLFDTAAGILSGEIRPGLFKDAPEVAALVQENGLEPFLTGQLLSNVFLRKTWFQTKTFAETAPAKIEKQLLTATEKLKQLEEGKQLSNEELLTIQAQLEEAYAFRLDELLSSNKATRDGADLALKNVSSQWNRIVEKNLQANIKDLSEYAPSSSINILGIKKEGQKFINQLNPNPKGKNIKTKTEEGDIVIKEGKPVSISPVNAQEFDKLNTIVQELRKLPDQLNFLNEKKSQESLKALVNIRQKLFNLKNSPDPAVNAKANELYDLVSRRFNPTDSSVVANSSEFVQSLGYLDEYMKLNENVLGSAKFAEALSKGDMDIGGIVAQYIQPGNFNMNALQQMMKSFDEVVPAGAEMTTDMIRDLWLRELLFDPSTTGQKINQWIRKDPEGLKFLLGNRNTVDDLIEVAKDADKLKNSLFYQAKELDGNAYEVVKSTINKAKGTEGSIGAASEIDELIRIGGGDKDMYSPYMVSVRTGIIEDVLSKSQRANERNPSLVTFDAETLEKEVNNVLSNPLLIKFFDDQGIQRLGALKSYFSRLKESVGAGAELARGQEAQKLLNNYLFRPFATTIDTGGKILKADVFARLFSGKVTPGTLAEIEKALPSDPLQATKIILKELVKEAGVEDEEYSGAATSTGTINIGPGKSIEMDLQSSDIAPQVPVEVPTTAIPGSSISSTQVVAPQPTMSGQPQQTNAARAQQAFPFDPIFAAADGGIADKGIMNTSRGRQMVV